MNSAPANPIHVQLARELGIPWPPAHRRPVVVIDLGPDKQARGKIRNAGWRQCGEVIEFPMIAADLEVGAGSRP